MLSRTFIQALKNRTEPAYRIAIRAGLHPATLSKIFHGAERVRENDERVIAVGRELGLTPAECFASDELDPNKAIANGAPTAETAVTIGRAS